MKKAILPLVLIILMAGSLSAQRCGTAVTAIPSDPTIQATFSPRASQLACIDSGSYVSDTIYFYNNSRFLSPDPNMPSLPISVKFDSINNLPKGLCWETNIYNDSFGFGQHGVIYISGYCTDTIGRYQLTVKADLSWLGAAFGSDYDLTQTTLYFLQVKHASDTCPSLDTTYIRPVIPAYITPGRDTVICDGSMVTLTANAGPGYQYRWSNGDTARSITVAGGYYTVTVYDPPAMGISQNISVYQENFDTRFQISIDSGNVHHQVLAPGYRNGYNGGYNSEYIWSWGDMAIDTGTMISHTYAYAGSFNLCLTILDTMTGCNASSCDTIPVATAGDSITVLSPQWVYVGEREIKNAATLKLYPNPNSGIFRIDINHLTNAAYLQLFDVTGTLVYKQKIKNDSNELKADLPSGIYQLYIQADGFEYRSKMAIIK